MNMIPQIDQRNFEQTYKNILKELMKIDKDENDHHFKLNFMRENVFLLP
jgi:hypothetical protein